MAAALSWRHPVAVARYRHGPVALAVVRLRSASAPRLQPAEDGPEVVAADLRLPRGSGSDIPGLWRHAGADFAAGLDGDFAVALWDGRQRMLALARDRLGIRPLFWAERPGGGVVFASFPEALVASGAVTGRLSREALAIAASGEPGPSFVDGVRRVEPGTVEIFHGGSRRRHRYWRLPTGPAARLEFDDAAQRLRVLLEEAVARALPAAGPVAANLSGGLDSGTVVALAARLLTGSGRRLTGYCFGLPEDRRHLGPPEEEAVARAVAAKAGAEVRVVQGDTWRSIFEGPLSNPFLVPEGGDSYWDSLLESVEGTDRVLCGFGGDELVSSNGTGALVEAIVTGRWLRLRQLHRHTPFPLWRGMLREVAETALPHRLEQRLRRLIGMSAPRAARYVRSRRDRPRPPLRAAERARARLENPALVTRLEEQAWYAARHGLRYVFPLLDWRLLEQAVRIPIHLQLHGRQRRALVRRALQDLLPAELLSQDTKLNPDPTGAYYLARRKQALLAEVTRLAASRSASELVDLEAIRAALEGLPDAEAVAARAGERSYWPELEIAFPFMAARAAAADELDHPDPAALAAEG